VFLFRCVKGLNESEPRRATQACRGPEPACCIGEFRIGENNEEEEEEEKEGEGEEHVSLRAREGSGEDEEPRNRAEEDENECERVDVRDEEDEGGK